MHKGTAYGKSANKENVNSASKHHTDKDKCSPAAKVGLNDDNCIKME